MKKIIFPTMQHVFLSLHSITACSDVCLCVWVVSIILSFVSGSVNIFSSNLFIYNIMYLNLNLYKIFFLHI